MKLLSKPPYKNERNNWLTRTLFDVVPGNHGEPEYYEPIFTLYDDKEGLVNVRKTFVELGDPTGYKWAMAYLDSWEHWRILEKCSWFRKALETWRDELAAKVQAEALDIIREIAQRQGDKQSLPAARFLAQRAWEKGSVRGRPSKAELTGELKRAAQAISEEDEDLKRIGLVK